MHKKILVVFLFTFFFSSSFIVASSEEVAKKPDVITTLFPTYDFARQIGRDKIDLTLLLPPGVEPHAYEPKPQDIVKISKADIFIYTGKTMEPWVENILKGISNKNLLVVDASSGIGLMSEDDHDLDEELQEGGHHDGKHSEAHDEHGHHHHGGKDPHIWLDLANDQIIVDTITKALIEKDLTNKEFYSKNAEEYKLKLASLDNRFKETLATAKHKTIIYGGHFAFGYFAKRYGLEYNSPYKGFSPNAEPSPKSIVELMGKMKKTGSKYIYHEELLDPKIARTIADETGAKLELLHGAHNISKDELSQGKTFLDIMEDNLNKLKIGLECQ